jgi:hypothetical protein
MLSRDEMNPRIPSEIPSRPRLEGHKGCGVERGPAPDATRLPILATEDCKLLDQPFIMDVIGILLRKFASHWLQLTQERTAGSKGASSPRLGKPRNTHAGVS